DDVAGIRRKRSGRGFTYVDPDGKSVTDADTLKRIRSLVIPPAWTNVWICASEKGHIQAVGRDARGRKQYRYHPLYRAVRDATKFARMAEFGRALPDIRKQVQKDLELSGLPKQKVLAAVVRLLETTCIRVGNEEYAKENDSYGLTTMREEHVDVDGRTIHFHFRGKSGLTHDIDLTDRKLAKIVQQCQDLPGEELFHYVDDDGSVSKIYSEDVNEYLRAITGQDFTAKDFRTWVGTGQAAVELEKLGAAASETEAKKNIVAAIKAVASKLGNKPSTCRKYYVHPAILTSYSSGSLLSSLTVECSCSAEAHKREEICVLKLVQQPIALPQAAA
ncbi:MAG: DNA topoisomerase IB, partial [Acidobacteriaceae bacterium]|nr:DNA topoisomerase IB [Acidobacteriaceae bacterium]